MTELARLKKWTALAAAAHPNDIEFLMAGTLLRLREAGAEIHMWNLCTGASGSAILPADQIVRVRWEESQASARIAGAVLHAPILDDLTIAYTPGALARAASVIRDVRPDLMLVPSPQDYSEDHQNACRLLVTAAFVRAMPNFVTDPPAEPWNGETVIYHAMPHGLRDGLRRLVRPGQFVNVSPLLSVKRAMLAEHKTQQEWLQASQAMDSFLNEMESMSRQVGKMSGRFDYAEGWRRHSHLGFSRGDFDDPLTQLLGRACWNDPAYEQSLG